MVRPGSAAVEETDLSREERPPLARPALPSLLRGKWSCDLSSLPDPEVPC